MKRVLFFLNNKRRIFPVTMLSFMLLFSASVARASLINVLSQEYTIDGWAHYYFNDPNYPEYGSPFTVGYQETSTSPVSQHTVWPAGTFTGYAYAESSASGGVTSHAAWVSAHAYLDDEGYAISGSSASASIIFSPLASTMRVSADRLQATDIALLDLTTGTTVYSYAGFYSSESILLSFDTDHIYSMRTEIDVAGTSWIDFGGCLHIESVPEPATVLLLASGLVCLATLGRRSRKR